MPVPAANRGVYYPFCEIFIGTPFEERGTVNLVNGDATVEFSGAYVTATMDEQPIVFDITDGTNYKNYVSFVGSVTDSDTLELKSVYGGANNNTVSYRVTKSYASGNWFIRCFPQMNQFSGQTGDVILPIPLDTTSGSAKNTAQTLPMQSTKYKRHIDALIYGDSSTNSGSVSIDDIEEDIGILCDYDGLLGFRCGNLKYNGSGGGETGSGSTTGVRITQFNIKNKRFEGVPNKAQALLQMDIEVCNLL